LQRAKSLVTEPTALSGANFEEKPRDARIRRTLLEEPNLDRRFYETRSGKNGGLHGNDAMEPDYQSFGILIAGLNPTPHGPLAGPCAEIADGGFSLTFHDNSDINGAFVQICVQFGLDCVAYGGGDSCPHAGSPPGRLGRRHLELHPRPARRNFRRRSSASLAVQFRSGGRAGHGSFVLADETEANTRAGLGPTQTREKRPCV
jgi:hypothetical protein